MCSNGETAGRKPDSPRNPISRGIPGRLFCSAALLAVMLASMSAPTAQALEPGRSSTPSSTRPYYACVQHACGAMVDPTPVKTVAGYELPAGGPLLEGGGELGGYDPRQIQSAYRIPTSGGSGQTVAVVDAFGAPDAQSALSTYRERYGLEPCTKANGCFKRVNQKGEEGNYPKVEPIWELETNIDLDMVSAACPHCHILLVEAREENFADLGAAVDTAVRLGATEVSNSYGRPEGSEFCGTKGCTQYRSDYEHFGVPITAAGGDEGYNGKNGGQLFPAAAPGVIAVGGTNLYKAINTRGWREEAWEETGSGCSAFEPKPTAQTDTGCGEKRTDNDVAAVGGCKTPVSVYVKFLTADGTTTATWYNACGTSVAAPIVAAVEAYATPYTQSLGPEAFYLDTEALFDVKTGSNGTCSPAYLCTAYVGYDGPTGLGTPDGVPFVHPPY
jgi:subtilase family serine protease